MCLGALKAAPTRALAGDLVLQGVGNGCFPAYEAATGARLWRFNAAPIRWAVNGLGEERSPFEPDIVAHWDGVSFGSQREALAIALPITSAKRSVEDFSWSPSRWSAHT